MNLHEFDSFLILYVFCFLWDFSHLWASRASQKQNHQSTGPPNHDLQTIQWDLALGGDGWKLEQKKAPNTFSLILVLKVLFPTRYSFFSIISHDLVKVENCCTVGAAFEADLGSCQSKAKWARLLPPGNCVGEVQGEELPPYWLFSLWFWNRFGHCTFSCWSHSCKLF